jgi:putative MATE family efflux protein
MSKAVSMTQGPLVPILLRVALPITFANLLQSAYQLVNTLFVGRLGAESVAAVAASGPLFEVLISLGSGLSTAGAVLMAQHAGAGHRSELGRIAGQTLLMVGAMALCFMAIGQIFAPQVLHAIGVEPSIAELAIGYLRIRYCALLPMFAFIAIQAMLNAAGEVRYVMTVMACSVGMNAALDPWLIFGIGAWPGLGVRGAALATLTAQSLAFAVALTHLVRGRSVVSLQSAHLRPRPGHLRQHLGLALPASIEQGTRTFGSVILMSVAAGFGTHALATYGLGTRLLFFWFSPMLGLSVATAILVGQNLGAGHQQRAVAAVRTASLLALGAFTAIGLALLPLVPWIMRALTPGEPTLIRDASVFAYIYCPFLGLFAVPQVLNGAFRGAGSTRLAMALSLTMLWLFQLPSGLLLAYFTSLGVVGVWWSYPIGNVLATIVCAAWFKWGRWGRNLAAAAT